jgi:hypothetical protein
MERDDYYLPIDLRYSKVGDWESFGALKRKYTAGRCG